MCDFTDCEKWKELDCSQFRADIFLSPTCYRPLKAKKVSGSKVPCSDGLCAELSLMLDVFNSCIETKTLPATGSPCQVKVIELLKKSGRTPTAKSESA